MSNLSVIKTYDAAIITVGTRDVTVTMYNGKLIVFVIDHTNGTSTLVDGRYPEKHGDDMQSESMMLHGGA